LRSEWHALMNPAVHASRPRIIHVYRAGVAHFAAMRDDNQQVFPGFEQVNLFVGAALDPATERVVTGCAERVGSSSRGPDAARDPALREEHVPAALLVSRLIRLTRGGDQIVFHSGFSRAFWGNLPLLLLLRREVTVVFWGAEMKRGPGLKGALFEASKRVCVPRVRAVCLSEADADRLARQYGRPKVLKVIPYYDRAIAAFASLRPNAGAIRVQIGNNGEPVNDHLRCLDALEGVDGLQPTVILPFGYCRGDEQYVRSIEAAARRRFRVEAFHELLPLSEFDRLVSSCDVLLIGSTEQRALANIYRYLIAGRPVFLPTSSTLRADLQREGFILHALEDLSGMCVEEFVRLARTSNEVNRACGPRWIGLDTLRHKWADVVGVKLSVAALPL
jgi:hypothetical protein